MTIDNVWHHIFSSRDWARYPSEDIIRFFARHFYQVPNRQAVQILEVGCGPGPNMWYLAREGFTVYGIDFAPKAIELAQKRLDNECAGWKGQLIVGDMMSLPFQNESFDAVVDSEAIYCNNLERSKKIYDEVYRVLKPKGRFFIRTFSDETYGSQTGSSLDERTRVVSEGPLKDHGPARFMKRSDFESLLPNFKIHSAELLTRTYDATQKKVAEWIIDCQK